MRTITENNGLIAEFIGYDTKQLSKGVASLEGNKYVWGQKHYHINNQWYKEDALQYHEDWNWLIPAVIKCKERQFFGSNSLITRLNNALVQADIDAVYEQVIEFINYYNKQNENNNRN